LSFAEELLEAGVRLYQYQKGFIHAKTTIVDRTLAVVGTANMDMRSFIHNFEINAVLFDPPQIEQLERDFARDLQDSVEMSLERFRSLPRTDKMRCACARLLSSLL
jgi:cardiolipin synthase